VRLEADGSALQETAAYTLSAVQLRCLLVYAGIAHSAVPKAQHPNGWTPKDQAVALILLHGINKYGYCTRDPETFDPIVAFAEPTDDAPPSPDAPAPSPSPTLPPPPPSVSREASAALAAVRQLAAAPDPSAAAQQSSAAQQSGAQLSRAQPPRAQPSAPSYAHAPASVHPHAHEQPPLPPPPPQRRPPVADPAVLDEWADRFLDGGVPFADLPSGFAASIIDRVPLRRNASGAAALPRPPPAREPAPLPASASASSQLQSLFATSSGVGVGQGRWVGTEEKLPAADSKLIVATRQRLSLLATSYDTVARPDIQASVISAAIAGQHVNIALFRPRSDTSLPEQSLSFMLANDDGTVTARMPVDAARKTSPIASFIDWTQCYLEYERIVTSTIPEAVHLTRPYFKLIAYLAVLNAPAAIRYDNAHRKHLERAAWPSNYAARLDSVWLDSTMHASVAAFASAGQAPAPTFSRARNREPRAAAVHAAAAPAPSPSPSNTCRNWNNGVACNPQFVDANHKCRFVHACAGCGSDTHKQSDCTTRPTSSAARGRGRGGRGRGRNVTRHF